MVIKKSKLIPSSFKCKSALLHAWNDLGIAGFITYKCMHCEISINSRLRPLAAACSKGKEHSWTVQEILKEIS